MYTEAWTCIQYVYRNEPVYRYVYTSVKTCIQNCKVHAGPHYGISTVSFFNSCKFILQICIQKHEPVYSMYTGMNLFTDMYTRRHHSVYRTVKYIQNRTGCMVFGFSCVFLFMFTICIHHVIHSIICIHFCKWKAFQMFCIQKCKV